MKNTLLQFKVRTWIQLGLLPALTGVAVWIGWGLYGELRQVILNRFDQQLTSPSVVAAAFIDPVAHQWLAENRRVRALTYNPKADMFYALADSGGRTALVRLDPESGSIEEPGIHLSLPVSDLAFDPASGWLVGVFLAEGRLGRIHPVTGMVELLVGAPPGIRQISGTGGKGGIFILGRKTLGRWDLQKGELTEEIPVPESVNQPSLAGAEASAGDGRLMNALYRGLNRMDPNEKQVGPTARPGVLTFPPNVGYDEKRKRWVVAQERLRLLDPATGRVGSDSFKPAYGREETDEYREIVEPLFRLRERLGLSYLYTQIVESPDLITYVVDSPEKGTHSELMSKDILPATEVEGVARLKADGSLHFSRMERWERWGWLKSAFAPIFDADDRVVGMVGTDFNASVIENSTRQALLMVFVIGGITLVIASAWSLTISRWLRRPVEALNAGALEVAAGDFRPLQVNGSQEINLLAEVFNQVSTSLKVSATNLTEEVARLLRRRNRVEVKRVFVRDRLPAALFEDESAVAVQAGPFGLGGALVVGETTLVWWEDAPDQKSELTLRQLCAVPGQVAARFGTLPASAGEPVRWPDRVKGVLSLNVQEKTGVWWSRHHDETPVQSSAGDSVRIGWSEAGSMLVLKGFVIVKGGSS